MYLTTTVSLNRSPPGGYVNDPDHLAGVSERLDVLVSGGLLGRREPLEP
jgi:hypothetical protein